VKWLLLTVFTLFLLIICVNAVVVLQTFGPRELIEPPLVFFVGIHGAGMVLMLALWRWVILSERATFGWGIIAGRRPREPVLGQAWFTGRVVFTALSTMTLLLIVFALTGL
jgi:hypothetical protein